MGGDIHVLIKPDQTRQQMKTFHGDWRASVACVARSFMRVRVHRVQLRKG